MTDYPNDQGNAKGAIPVWLAGVDGGAAVIPPEMGGTGVANDAKSTITVAGPVEFAGEFSAKLNLTANTDITFPTKGTLATNDVFTKSVNGLAPGPASQPANTFLRDDATWQTTPIIYRATDSGDALSVPNNGPPSGYAIAVSVAIPASNVARVFIVSGIVSLGAATGASPNYAGVQVTLDPGVSASTFGGTNLVNTIDSAAMAFGATACVAGIAVTVPGDGAGHVIGLGLVEQGGGTGFTCTTGTCHIACLQVP